VGTDSDGDPVNKCFGSCHKTCAVGFARHCPGGWILYTGLPWPVRRADYAVTYGDQ
jgi:hypothetical protein